MSNGGARGYYCFFVPEIVWTPAAWKHQDLICRGSAAGELASATSGRSDCHCRGCFGGRSLFRFVPVGIFGAIGCRNPAPGSPRSAQFRSESHSVLRCRLKASELGWTCPFGPLCSTGLLNFNCLSRYALHLQTCRHMYTRLSQTPSLASSLFCGAH